MGWLMGLTMTDSRLLHSAYPNQSAAERSLLTLWYLPKFEKMPAAVKNRLCGIFSRTDLDIDANGRIVLR